MLTTVLFGAVLCSLAVRLYIRFYLQRKSSVDDGFIIFGVTILTAAMAILFYSVDGFFMAEALLMEDSIVKLHSHVIQDSLDSRK